ncbi:50S ribosomal protein L13 [Candidatus Micrarchaeota archaeon]|nr:50S ribosomal protein L13 [Candidatus Micrarchaeota archaeon]
MKVYDGDGYILGRLSSVIAKDLLNGENVILLNAEKLFITGSKKDIFNKYLKRRQIKSHQNPEHSPKWPRKPDLLVRRIIRGMLPYKKPRGKIAFRKLKVYIGVPEKLKQFSEKSVTVERARVKDGQKGIDIGKLCQMFGYQINNPIQNK